MKTIMKLLTMAVLLMAVVGICGCTSAPQTNLSNTTANATKNTTKAAIKPTKAPVKPMTTIKPTPAQATPATPTPVTNWAQQQANMHEGQNQYTPTATPYPTLKNLHGEDSGQLMNPTPTPIATPVAKIPTQVSISQNSNPTKSGSSITFTFSVSAKTVPIPGQTVSFDVSGKQLGSATTGSNGYGTFTFSTAGLAPILPAGISVGGTYAGNSQYASSWGTMGYYIIA